MCTRPILIRNKKLSHLEVPTRNLFIKVPCGCCDECLRKRAKDLYIRARFEFERCCLNGGCGFMCCLTYDDSLLPYLEFEGKRYMVFNKQDVILFIKRLRVQLDRFFKKNYNTSAPDFKYLVTSEYGTDPTRSHRPHYHLLFLFNKCISYYVFRKCFIKSLVNSKTGKRYFGKIFQCDLLDIKKGGIKYTSKYILKDMMYSRTDSIIREFIKLNTDAVNSKFGILPIVNNEDDLFYNKCIRSTKAYRKAIRESVGCYRNMLQFYMCSNDFGCTAIIERYGDSLFTLGVLNIDTFPYSIPKSVIQKIERSFSYDRKDELVKSVFMNRLQDILMLSVKRDYISGPDVFKYLDFANRFLDIRFGSFYLVPPSSLSVSKRWFNVVERVDDSILEEYSFYDDNNFYQMRDDLISLINLCNDKETLEFRAKVAKRKTQRERDDYEKKKRNKPSNY